LNKILEIDSVEWDKNLCAKHQCPLDIYKDPKRQERILLHCPAGAGRDTPISQVNAKTIARCPRVVPQINEPPIDLGGFNDFS
jgi:hypothetical protein